MIIFNMTISTYILLSLICDPQKEKNTKAKEREVTIEKLNAQIITLDKTASEAKELAKKVNATETEVERLRRELEEVTRSRDQLAADLENTRKASEEVSQVYVWE